MATLDLSRHRLGNKNVYVDFGEFELFGASVVHVDPQPVGRGDPVGAAAQVRLGEGRHADQDRGAQEDDSIDSQWRENEQHSHDRHQVLPSISGKASFHTL